MGVSEIEISEMDLEPLSALSDRKEAKVLSLWEWKQLPREQQKEVNLVVSSGASSDLLLHEVRVIDRRVLLMKKCYVDLDTGSASSKSGSENASGTSAIPTSRNSEVGRSKRYSDKELLEELQRLRQELGHPPTANDISEYGVCSYVTISERFGGLSNAREQAGVGQPTSAPPNKIDKDDLIQELKRVSEKIGRVPSIRDIDNHSKYSQTVIWREFGGITNAIVEAGLRHPAPEGPTVDDWNEYKSRNQVPKNDGYGYTEDELLRELQVLAKSLGRRPQVKDIKEHSKYSYSPYRDRWGSISEARKAAGVEDYNPDDKED